MKDKEEKPFIIDNKRYTNQDITLENLKEYSDKEYEENAKKMNADLLHAVSEQRCRPFGCRLQNCLGQFNEMNKCMTLFRQLNWCVEDERKKTIYEFIKTGVQPKH